MILTEFSLGLPGRVFGSAMPFGSYDPEHRILDELKRQIISIVVVLTDTDPIKVMVTCGSFNFFHH